MTGLVKVVGLCGSLRKGSHSLMALRIALDAAARAGAEVTLFDPAESALPFCGGTPNEIEKANAAEWCRLVLEADALILATPEYHGSYSGVIKNALDLVSFDEMGGKVIGLISVLGGSGSHNALNHLRLVCRAVHAWVIPHQASVGGAHGAFDDQDRLIDQKLRERVERVGTDVVETARRLRRPPGQ